MTAHSGCNKSVSISSCMTSRSGRSSSNNNNDSYNWSMSDGGSGQHMPIHNHLHLPAPLSPSIGHGRMRSFPDQWREHTSSIYGFPSVLSSPHHGPSLRLFLIDDPTPPLPTNYEWPRDEDGGSRLSREEQKNALTRLRKQLYSPHMSAIINRLSRTKSNFIQDVDNKKSCTICLDDFKNGQFVTVTPCNHMFHEECIVPWVKTEGKCPVCRFVFTSIRN